MLENGVAFSRYLTVLGLSALLGSGVLLAPHEAEACGGTFCDAFTPDMPVDQTAEGILFVSDGDFVEAHVQIQYAGGASSFAWVVPVPSVAIVEESSAKRNAVSRHGILGTMVLQGRVTELIDAHSLITEQDPTFFERSAA